MLTLRWSEWLAQHGVTNSGARVGPAIAHLHVRCRLHMSSYAIIIYLVGLMSVCVSGIISFDWLVQLQRRAHPDEWERDGRPWHGFGPGGAAWKRYSLTWFFSTPPWTRSDTIATRLLRLYRCLGLIFHLGLAAGVLYNILH